MDVREIIIDHMKRLGITYDSLGKAMGVSRQRAWDMLHRKSNTIGIKPLKRICKALDLDLEISIK